MTGLVRHPIDDRLTRGFEEGVSNLKLAEPSRWARWPFAPESGKLANANDASVPAVTAWVTFCTALPATGLVEQSATSAVVIV